jgi:acyl-CoA thioesterase-2
MNPTEELVDLLDLEELDTDLFRGRQPETQRARVYGGQVAAQAVVAAVRTVPSEFTVHSLHSYFLLGGDYSVPIVYDVERPRDGRSFVTRRVVARQHGRPIYYQSLNFQRPEEGWEHQDAMPSVGAPDSGVDLVELMRQGGNAEADALGKEWGSLDVRWLGNTRHGLEPDGGHVSQARMWIRLREGLGDDPLVHTAAFTYASDVSLLGSTLAAHGGNPARTQMASLDHTIWFHRPFRADEWWLTLVATVAQEGLIRPRQDGYVGPGQA